MLSKALIVGSLAASAIAQTTLNLFVDGSSNEKFVGSIVNAKCDETTIALLCTHGSFGDGIESTTCDPSATVSFSSTSPTLVNRVNTSTQILATYGPNSYEISTAATQDGTAVTLLETCSITSNTAAVCSFSIGAHIGGQSTSTSSSTTLTSINHFQIPITAGATKLPATAACTAAANAAAPTGLVDVYKILVVPAAILAGALA
jgi:hypothetical protein